MLWAWNSIPGTCFSMTIWNLSLGFQSHSGFRRECNPKLPTTLGKSCWLACKVHLWVEKVLPCPISILPWWIPRAASCFYNPFISCVSPAIAISLSHLNLQSNPWGKFPNGSVISCCSFRALDWKLLSTPVMPIDSKNKLRDNGSVLC